MKFAVVAPIAAGVTGDPVWMTEFARHLEACGFESIIMAEHTVLVTQYTSVYPYDPSGRVDVAPECPVPDPLETNHHPVMLAKRAATVDVLAGGRLRLCVGVGWLREEIEACGAGFTSRGRRADEQIEVLRALWADNPGGVSHHGEFYDFDHAMSYPKPVAAEGIPIHIGGHSRLAARRAGRLGDGFQPLGVGGAELATLVEVMRLAAEDAGRDPASLELSLGHLVTKVDADRAGRLAEVGAGRLVLGMPAVTEIDEAKDLLSACAQRLGLRP
ncbi:MAG: LLM class F420-dependent oxidoreductase [Mycolicibacterium aromaticivorans]|nr:LLM class F420-dependent oxidoreductase [Mycolicibacterium aromaticivorans]